jgi:hypothetical protein
MTWFLVALVMFAGSEEVELKINTSLKFKNANDCKGYQTIYADGLDKGLRSAFPNITELNIQCVNNETLEEMQKQILKQDKK